MTQVINQGTVASATTLVRFYKIVMVGILLISAALDVQYFGPVIAALKGLGGSGRPAEVRYAIAELLTISEDDQAITMQSGESRFGNRLVNLYGN
jgi:hypothetical protein